MKRFWSYILELFEKIGQWTGTPAVRVQEGMPCEACDAYPVGHEAVPIIVEGMKRKR